ncbi:MAG: hypothetical protein A2474_05105 [Elusimicrobia bacterium RIFOXYC2_FULL_34_12]|nr:MAG: hypothetical protein A2474_05105 [Elusimicrobia bacterium RIFOXYC2_FULL_34_12]OGS39066.1 MAG: hypothetical protein A2551_05820 [Elusimicrobia bacterium RIFOXYD2_FULL_34_30]HAM39207.1 DUF2905 domain-containing protein [Elusimicrobiota bacterium]
MNYLGKILIIIGVILIIIGIAIVFNFRIPYIGKLPGDIYIKKDNFSFFFPLTSSIIISIIISFVLWLITKK